MQRFAVLLAAGLLAGTSALAARIDLSKLPPASTQPNVTYEKNIRPIFQASCARCHHGPKPKARLRLDSLAGVLKGAKFGKVVIPGDSEHSKLVWAVSRLNPKTAMPPKPHPPHGRPPGNFTPQGGHPVGAPPGKMPPPPKPLTAAQIGLIRAWIDQGAK